MPRKYRHIKEYEKEILELKKQAVLKGTKRNNVSEDTSKNAVTAE